MPKIPSSDVLVSSTRYASMASNERGVRGSNLRMDKTFTAF